MSAASPAEWAAFLSLGVGVWSAGSGLVLLICDADWCDFDPRPAVRRAHQGAVYAGHDLNRAAASVRHEVALVAVPVWHAAYSARETARDLAALLILLTTSPKGALR